MGYPNAVYYGIVTWKPHNADFRIYLKLETSITREAGLKPDVFAATVNARDFDKLGGDWDRSGNVELWWQFQPSDPDGYPVRLDNWRIVDIEPMEFGFPAKSSTPRVLTYRLSSPIPGRGSSIPAAASSRTSSTRSRSIP